MNISFKSNINHSYMIIEKVPDFSEYHFMMKMLLENEIPELLRIGYEHINGSDNLLYDISARQVLSRLFEVRKMTFDNLRAFVLSLKDLLFSLREYLLDPDNVVLKQECIFADPDGMQFFYCYYPYYRGDFLLELRELLTKMLTMVDYEDERAVRLVYELHSEVHGDNFTTANLVEVYERLAGEEHLTMQETVSLEEWLSMQEPMVPALQLPLQKERYEQELYEYEDDTTIFEKIRYYLKGKTFMEVLEDINNREIMEKIRQCGKMPEVVQSYRPEDVLLPEKKPDFEYISLSDVELHDTFAETAEYGGFTFHEKQHKRCPKLVGINHQDGESFSVSKIPFTIGKSQTDSDAWLKDRTVSQLQARIYQTFDPEPQYLLEDLNSLNGTYLNDDRLPAYTKTPINEGDVLRFADTEFCFRQTN